MHLISSRDFPPSSVGSAWSESEEITIMVVLAIEKKPEYNSGFQRDFNPGIEHCTRNARRIELWSHIHLVQYNYEFIFSLVKNKKTSGVSQLNHKRSADRVTLAKFTRSARTSDTNLDETARIFAKPKETKRMLCNACARWQKRIMIAKAPNITIEHCSLG